ncbi:NAD(P)/FAD-dependent oxidoreductase [Edaphocola aurantiacus]|uniref:NAD(P)/FAD-dependent oxidoreductase n=1 Tax=Edaphocola aurantiacus TaxID=2601682 RepID=UPI001C94F988|nr:NAD(P)/FAD-dependent oxidoreductase [Edaphocola aurantiacus]
MIQEINTQQPSTEILYDAVVIGGSYAGLSAAMALGRALRKVLIIDSGMPCNRQTPHSHNFLTRDGSTPAELSAIALEQVLAYPTISLCKDIAINSVNDASLFTTTTASGDLYKSHRLVLATGIKDMMPEIPGIAECWGISVIHCPYCHGYEYHSQPTAILANGKMAFEFAMLLYNWSKELYLLTNGPVTMTEEQISQLRKLSIHIIEQPLASIRHKEGKLEEIIFDDDTKLALPAMYARLPFVQHSTIAANLGCALTEQGHIVIDMVQQTSIAGVYACGDNSSGMRSVAQAVYSGSMAGAALNRELNEALLKQRLV